MRKSSIVLSLIVLILFILLVWQWSSKNYYASQIRVVDKYNTQLSMLSGIGALKSTHLHADIKVYINGKPVDFSQKKYQLTTSFIHFEEGIGDVIHTHATGLTIGHLLNSVGMGLSNNEKCIRIEGNNYCNEGNKTLKFYVNGQLSKEIWSYVIKDLDKYLISYGDESEGAIKKQIDSVTSLAQKYRGK